MIEKNIAYRRLGITVSVLFLTFSMIVRAQDNASGGLTTVADKGTSGMYLAKLCPDHDVSVDKNIGDAFSIYVDTGTPYFNKLRVRSGMYNVKAGECVVFKTIEAMSFEIPEAGSDIKSSLYSSDIICPTEDTPTADFIAQHSVGEGEHIYMLTNMERNGGFGFTHFVGDTMRKGSFFIISTFEPEPTGIQHTLSTASTPKVIYDLSGRQVQIPRSGQIYICEGRKFVYGGKSESAEICEKQVDTSQIHTRADMDIEDGDVVPFLSGDAGNDDGF